ncbi:response regulator (plasmid) [Rhizobium acidisoli]|uniref:Response regulator n=1 Tax=Rhizobium acidisoli TaxID=1538158 RepID=A0AAE6C503_9HYPH|nr:response regulator [Rhizobium acidisoli]KPH06225.1 response regulator [Rhizobium acidisoli]QAS82170.1 response regulator [Rhizobium acidisoli]
MYKRTVLIVEDDLLIRMVLADTLAEEGYDVIEAGNVLEAVAVLGRRKIDAVITDVDMPGGLSGLDLARMISSSDMKVPVIITSGGSIVRPEELPSDAVFMPKPYGMNAISAMVGEMTAAETRKMAS